MQKMKYLLAVSGGPDSMALLDLATRKHQVYAVVHVNYHWRKTANRDLHIVQQYCHLHHLKLFIKTINPLIYQQNKIKNFEAWARQVRYNFFNLIANITNHHHILMAHHLDDYLETAIMQLTSHRSLFHYGIVKNNEIKHLIINRPFLKKYWKIDLVNYCQKHHLSYGIDETNNDPQYFRNYVRLILNKQTKNKNHLLQLIEQLNGLLASQYRKSLLYYWEWRKTNNIANLLKLSFNYQLNLLKIFLYSHHINNLSQNKLEGIIGFLHSNLNQKAFRVATNTYLRKINKSIFLIKDSVKSNKINK